MSIVVSKSEVKEYEKLKTVSQLVPIKEKIKLFERKYGSSFKEFEEEVKRGEEDFEKWDDYIEWKAYLESMKELTAKLKEIEDAEDVRVA